MEEDQFQKMKEEEGRKREENERIQRLAEEEMKQRRIEEEKRKFEEEMKKLIKSGEQKYSNMNVNDDDQTDGINKLKGMGFSEEDAKNQLALCGGDVMKAVHSLLSFPSPTPSPPNFVPRKPSQPVVSSPRRPSEPQKPTQLIDDMTAIQKMIQDEEREKLRRKMEDDRKSQEYIERLKKQEDDEKKKGSNKIQTNGCQRRGR